MTNRILSSIQAIFRLSVVFLAIGFLHASNATVIDFEEYGYGNSPRDIFFPMNGYYFSPMITIIDVSHDSPLYSWLGPAPSGKFVAINGTNQPITISGDSFSGASILIRTRNENSTATATVTLWDGNRQIESFAQTYGSTWAAIALSAEPATTVRIATSEVSLFDDVLLPTATVPEPTPQLLMLAGLSFLCFVARAVRYRSQGECGAGAA